MAETYRNVPEKKELVSHPLIRYSIGKLVKVWCQSRTSFGVAIADARFGWTKEWDQVRVVIVNDYDLLGPTIGDLLLGL